MITKSGTSNIFGWSHQKCHSFLREILLPEDYEIWDLEYFWMVLPKVLNLFGISEFIALESPVQRKPVVMQTFLPCLYISLSLCVSSWNTEIQLHKYFLRPWCVAKKINKWINVPTCSDTAFFRRLENNLAMDDVILRYKLDGFLLFLLESACPVVDEEDVSLGRFIMGHCCWMQTPVITTPLLENNPSFKLWALTNKGPFENRQNDV